MEHLRSIHIFLEKKNSRRSNIKIKMVISSRVSKVNIV